MFSSSFSRTLVRSERKPASFADDARFSRVHVDPRFKRLDRARQSKQDVDKRFAGMFTDKEFTTSVKVGEARERGREGLGAAGRNRSARCVRTCLHVAAHCV